MIRAVVKNNRGDVVRGPFNFQTDGDYNQFASSVVMGRERFHERVELVQTKLSFEEAVMLDGLQSVALNANGFLKHFVMDGDLYRRIKNRELGREDIALLAMVLSEASDSFKELATKERGFEEQAQQSS
jgi:hypothetical protein